MQANKTQSIITTQSPFVLFDYRMHDQQSESAPADSVIDFTLNISGKSIPLGLGFKNCEGKLSQLVPVAQKISSIVTDINLKDYAERGCRIPCRKGCSSCCKYIIPISSAEAAYLHDYTLTLPNDTRRMILHSFMRSARKIASSKAPKIPDKASTRLDQLNIISKWYETLQLNCPFLYDDQCSIYNHRPLACREYYVTTPPEYCDPKTPESQKPVALTFSIAEMMMDISNSLEETEDEAIILPLTMIWFNMNKKRTEKSYQTKILAESLVQILTNPKKSS